MIFFSLSWKLFPEFCNKKKHQIELRVQNLMLEMAK